MIKGGVDLVLAALNRARKQAERVYDWDCERQFVHGTITNGVGSRSAMLDENDEPVKIKQFETLYLTKDGIHYPLYHHSKKHKAVQSKQYLHSNQPLSRYLSDAEVFTGDYKQRLPHEAYLFGDTIEIKPLPTENYTLSADAFVWLPDYAAPTDTDFFVEHGDDYLMWAAIVECNHLTQTFVPQQEGNLAPPIKARDESLATLREYDAFIVESGRQP